MKIQSLLYGAYATFPQCQYILIGTNIDNGTVALTDQYDEHGRFIGHNTTVEAKVTGILSERSEETTQTAEGIVVNAKIKLTTTANIKMPGFDNVDDRIRWALKDEQGRQYRLGNKRRYGKLYTYTGTYSIHENH